MVKLTLLSVVLLMITGNITTLKILTGSDRANSFDQHQKVIQILKQCFRNELTTIIAALESSQYVMDFRKELPDTSIILVNNGGSEYNQKWLFSDAPIYVLETGSEEDLGSTLTTLQLLPWWGRSAPFFLIGSSNNSCVDAKKILSTMWTEKISSTIYVCHDHEDNNYKIFTFNPFTNKAPEPWKLSRYNSAGRWTLYEQLIQEKSQVCATLMFDKTQHMAGYTLKAATASSSNFTTIDLESLPALKPFPFNVLIPTVFITLNVTIVIYSNESARLTDKGMNQGLKKLWKGDYDIYFDERPLGIMYDHITDVLITSDIAIITRKRPFLGVEEKILLFFHLHASVLIIIVIFMSIMVLKIYKSQKCIAASLEICRLLIGTGIRQPLNSVPIRIYLFGIFWLAIILSGTFQGNLASFLTRPKRLLVETVEDLKKLNYHTYGTKTWLAVHRWRLSSLDQSSIHNFPNKPYDVRVINGTENAIIGPASQLYKIARKHKLHLSLPVDSVYAVWWTSADFVLKRRLNSVLSNCQESGLISFWKKKGYMETREKLLAEEINETRKCTRSINCYDLLFAFKFLILGLSCSLLVFIIELGRHSWFKNRSNIYH